MRRLPTVMASAGAAALTTLAVAVAGPAIGDDGGGGGGRGATYPGTAEAVGACLSAHGVSGVPTDDALKPWIRQRMDAGDAPVRAAMETCSPKMEAAPADQAAAEQQLRSCLKDNGAAVSDATGRDLKTWILEHQSDPATATALKACHLVVGDHPAQTGCDKRRASGDGAGQPGDAPEAVDKASRARAAKRNPGT